MEKCNSSKHLTISYILTRMLKYQFVMYILTYSIYRIKKASTNVEALLLSFKLLLRNCKQHGYLLKMKILHLLQNSQCI